VLKLRCDILLSHSAFKFSLRHYSVDKTEAAAWFRQAAEAGHAGSQFVLGMMCLK
jgi:TPR repeat protein